MKANLHWRKFIFLFAFIFQGIGDIAQADQKKLNH